jgi:hypothetical protein
MLLTKILICFSLCVFTLGTYFIWFDRKNIFNHLGIGLCFVAYIIPLCVLDLTDFTNKNVIDLYAQINFVGAITFILGLLLGARWKKITIVDSVMKFSTARNGINYPKFGSSVIRASKVIYSGCLIVMALCFLYMGFLPMFAADPYSAKQFKGVYNVRYHDVALFYRTAKQLIQLLMPFLLISYLQKKNLNILILIILGVGLIAVSLSRSEAVTGLILICSIIISLKYSKKVFIGYLFFLIFIYSLGSSFWVLASIYFPKGGYVNEIDNLSVGYAIASGAPDIPDQLNFLDAFVRNHIDYTYGLTFVGGIIPFNFKWNPAVWTLLVSNDTNDISEIASGGLRLPVSLWGYVSYGWIGVLLIPFISAFYIGYITKRIKDIINKLRPNANSYLIFYWLVFLYLNIGLVFTTFYLLSIYFLPAFLFYGMVTYFIKKGSARQPQILNNEN